MAFQIFITDNIDSIELDVEDIQTSAIYQAIDITDIGKRKTNINSLKFKGTKNNNYAFGSLFDLGRTTNTSLPNNLFFNYNPLQSCTALIYEDNNLIFKGTLRINQITADANGGIMYDTVLTDAFIDLKTALNDLYLSDLDFTDLSHHYTMTNIINSWSGSTERYNVATSGYTSQAFSYGSGYVYPLIDYGYQFTSGATANVFHASTFKPAIYLNTYLDKIFNQSVLSGFTYEIAGSDDFKTMFKHIVIPDCQNGNQVNIISGITCTYSMTGSPIYEPTFPTLNSVTQPPQIPILLSAYSSTYPDILQVTRNFTSSALMELNLSIDMVYSGYNNSFIVQFVKRPSENNQSILGWNVLAQNSFSIGTTGNTQMPISFTIPSCDFLSTEQIAILINATTDGYTNDGGVTYEDNTTYYVTSASITIPAYNTQPLSYSVNPSLSGNTADIIIPQAPAQIKQIDFLKSIIQQFNFQVYPSPYNQKHLIFEKYDDYYVFAEPQYLIANALDWTNKIDYSKGFNFKTNISLPSSYDFKYKSDNDYLTKYYQIDYNQQYGELIFNDSLGLIEKKTIELIFAPLIVQQQPTISNLIYPLLYQYESNVIKTIKTVPRLGYYNGLFSGTPYTVQYETTNINNVISYPVWYNGTSYPQISNYYISGGTAICNLHFAEPFQYYFTKDSTYSATTTGYNDYYINQITDLINPDVTYMEVQAYLTENDISNLDLKVPVYINTGLFNGAYFKVLKVEYTGNKNISKVSLQKIAL